MKKKIEGINEKLLLIAEGSTMDRATAPSKRDVLRTLGNTKAATADEARRVHRIVSLLRVSGQDELVLETDDLNFLIKAFEKNDMNLTAWIQGQILETLESATLVAKEEMAAV